MRAYMVLPKHDERGPLFAKNEFVYDAEKDLYICPQGETCAAKATTTRRDPSGTPPQVLRLQRVPPQEPLHEEQEEGTLALRRSFEEEYLERV